MERRGNKTATPLTLSALSHNSIVALDQAIAYSESFGTSTLRVLLEDERGRLRVWASNLGALQPAVSMKSLDHRLGDAPLMRKGVASGLERLQLSAKRALAILDGSTPNRSASPVSDSLDTEPGNNSRATTELDELVLGVHSAINHLFGLSMLIRRQRPRGRLRVLDSFTTLESSPDITYVTDRFPKSRSTLWLARRLGNEITRRRELIRYRQLHRQSLAKRNVKKSSYPGLGDTATLADTVVATTFQEADHSGAAHQTQQDVVGSPSSVFTSATSFLSLEDAESTGRHIPDLSDMSLDGVQLQYGEPFECPYCRTIQEVKNRHEWKRHVFTDLQPYVCTFRDCVSSNQLFPTRAEWFQHESTAHRRLWVCHRCNAPDTTFGRAEELKGHLHNVHRGMVTEAQMPLILEACERPTKTFGSTSCPLCTEWEPQSIQNNEKAFSRHLARHLQQLALEALPLTIDGLEVRNMDGIFEEEGSVSGESSNGEISTYQAVDSPPAIPQDEEDRASLWQAAENGVLATVKRLLEKGADPNKRDSEFGRTPLSWAASNGHEAIVRLLLEKGADPEKTDSAGGRTPLSWASSNGLEAIVRLLLPKKMYELTIDQRYTRYIINAQELETYLTNKFGIGYDFAILHINGCWTFQSPELLNDRQLSDIATEIYLMRV